MGLVCATERKQTQSAQSTAPFLEHYKKFDEFYEFKSTVLGSIHSSSHRLMLPI